MRLDYAVCESPDMCLAVVLHCAAVVIGSAMAEPRFVEAVEEEKHAWSESLWRKKRRVPLLTLDIAGVLLELQYRNRFISHVAY